MPVQQSVLQLEIPVNNAFPVAVVNRDDQLLEEPACLRLLDALLLYYVVKGITAVRVLHGNAQEFVRHKHLL